MRIRHFVLVGIENHYAVFFRQGTFNVRDLGAAFQVVVYDQPETSVFLHSSLLYFTYTYLFTYLLTYLCTYLFTQLLTHFVHTYVYTITY